MEDLIAVNTEKIQLAINDLNTILTNISKVFGQMEIIINDSKNYVSEEIGESIQNSFIQLKNDFPTIQENINTYILELSACKKSYINQDTESSILFQDKIKD